MTTTMLPDLVTTTEFSSVIGGKPCPGIEHEALLDPSTGARWGTVTYAADLVEQAIEVACAAHATGAWRGHTAVQRADVLEAIGRGIADRVEELAALESLATGKPLHATRAEVEVSARWWQYYAALLRTLRDQLIAVSATKESSVVHEPVGVVALVTPFNGAFPRDLEACARPRSGKYRRRQAAAQLAGLECGA